MPKRHTHAVDAHSHVSEIEINDLLKRSKQQCEEYVRLADLADLSDPLRPSQLRNGWDNPTGLVVADVSKYLRLGIAGSKRNTPWQFQPLRFNGSFKFDANRVPNVEALIWMCS